MKPRLLLALGALLLVGAAEAPRSALLPPAEAARQGRELVADILSQVPAQNTTNVGVLTFPGPGRKRPPIPVKFTALATATNWLSICEASCSNRVERLFVLHTPLQPNLYFYHTNLSANQVPLPGDVPVPGHLFRSHRLSEAEANLPFAGSDFWLADLGLEFFHWPEQRLLKTELRRSRSCRVLESTNPRPAPDAYSRVVSWIDSESGGIVFAEAYDFQNRVLKEFSPKDFKKVNGEWQLEEMEISNRQTGSRTRIEFDLGQK